MAETPKPGDQTEAEAGDTEGLPDVRNDEVRDEAPAAPATPDPEEG